jgi:hypothetical protein
MRYIFLGLALTFFFSCEAKKDDIGYRIEQENFDEFHSIKLVDKNNVEIVQINFNYDEKIISCSITDNKNFSSLVNLVEGGILSYTISDKNKYNNTTNYLVYIDGLIENNELILERSEQVDENTTYYEKIYKNGLVIKEKRTEE